MHRFSKTSSISRNALLLKSPSKYGCQPPTFNKFFSWQSNLYLHANKINAPKTTLSKRSTTGRKQDFSIPQNIYYSYAESLARRPSPLLLYQAPSHTAFVASSFALGTFCFSYAIINFHSNYLDAPPNIPNWAPVAFGGVCFMMVGFGTWLVLGPSRLIRTITAIPHPLTTPPTLFLRIELRRLLPLPFLKPRAFEASPSDITLSQRLYVPSATLKVVHPSVAWRQRQKDFEYERSRILSAPFRHFSQFCWRIVQVVARVWTREGFIKVSVKGRRGNWKLDQEGGWSLDDGRSLERLLKVK